MLTFAYKIPKSLCHPAPNETISILSLSESSGDSPAGARPEPFRA